MAKHYTVVWGERSTEIVENDGFDDRRASYNLRNNPSFTAIPRHIGRASLRAILGFVFLCGVSLDSAYGQMAFCSIKQITNTNVGESFNPSMNALGTRIAFDSFSNLTGANPDFSWELFLYDSIAAQISQQTINATGGILEPSMSANGRYVAFSSASDITGNNSDANREIFLADTYAAVVTQITHTSGNRYEGRNWNPSINADGSRIAFVSDRNLTGSNPDGKYQLFLFDVNTMTFSQLTNSIDGENKHPSINSDGTRIAFMSSSNLTGANSDHNTELFLLDTTTLILTQITSTSGGQSRFPSINADGTRIAFDSDRDLTGNNPDANREIFIFDTATMAFAQVTTTIGAVNSIPSITQDGTRIAFGSPADLTGSNPDLNYELFRFDANTMIFTQITNTSGSPGLGSHTTTGRAMSADGVRIAFASSRDIVGGNPDGNLEIFLAEFPDDCTPSSVLDQLEFLKDFVAMCPFCPPDPVQALLDQILPAIKYVRNGDLRAAFDTMGQFVTETERLITRELIPAAEGRRFVTMAEGITAELEETNLVRTIGSY